MMRVYVHAVFTALCFGRSVHANRPCDPNGKTLEDQVQEAKGIHNLDICRLTNSHHVGTEAEKVARACTAALVLVDGHAMAVTAATCFMPRAPTTYEQTFRKSPDGLGQLYMGDVTLNCGPSFEKLEIKSTFEKPKVIVHPEFVMNTPKPLAIAKNNLAVVRIAAEDYTRIPEAARPNFLFTRISDAKTTTGPTEDVSCRCYSPREAANTEPKEFKANRCPLDQRIKNVVFTADNTCFIVKKEHNEDEFNELKMNRVSLVLIEMPENVVQKYKKLQLDEKCIGGFCGIQQTMACFCKAKGGPTVSSLRALHSVGFYSVPGEKGDKTEIIFLGVPIGPNWPFLLAAKPTDAALGATDKQMQEVPANVDGVLTECIAAKKGDLKTKSIQHFICRDYADEGVVKKDSKGVKWSHDDLANLQKDIAECVAKHPKLILKGADDKPLPFAPVSEIMEMMMNGLDRQKLCAQADAKTNDPGLLRGAKLQAQCFGLLFRSYYRKIAFVSSAATAENVQMKSGLSWSKESWRLSREWCEDFFCWLFFVFGSLAFALTAQIGLWAAYAYDITVGLTGSLGAATAETAASHIL